jgi:hypothetical protein
MSIRYAFIASWLAIFGYAGPANANSCANVNVLGLFDQSGLQENEYGIYAAGTFRIAGEKDEDNQPMFNLTAINCEKQQDDEGKASLVCKMTQAEVSALSGKPDTDNPNCSLSLESSEYSMKELQKGILTGMESSAAGSSACYNDMLTIDRNAKRVYLSFMRRQQADSYGSLCGKVPQTEVLMNCTAYARMRNHGRTPPRYCDFSSSSDK